MREFDSFRAFGDHLRRANHRALEANPKGLLAAAKIIQAEAKAEIGTYQGAAGPFAKWPLLASSTVAEKERLGYAPPDNPLLREGDMRESIVVEAKQNEAVVASNDPVAMYQEFGTKTIRARSFLGGAAFRKSKEAARAYAKKVVGAIIGRIV